MPNPLILYLLPLGSKFNSRSIKIHTNCSNCRFIRATCHACGKKGRMAPVCKPRHVATELTTPRRDEVHLFAVRHTSRKSEPLQYTLLVDGKPISIGIDTGAEVSFISVTISLFSGKVPTKTLVVLRTYTRTQLARSLYQSVWLTVCASYTCDYMETITSGLWLLKLWLEEFTPSNPGGNDLASLLQKHQAVFQTSWEQYLHFMLHCMFAKMQCPFFRHALFL